MNGRPFFIVTYHILFTLLSIAAVSVLQEKGSALHKEAYYFNWIYFIGGGCIHYFFYLLLQAFYGNQVKKLLQLYFLTMLFFMNVFSFFLGDTVISFNLFKGILNTDKQAFWAAVIIHGIMLASCFLAFFITKKSMQQKQYRLAMQQFSRQL